MMIKKITNKCMICCSALHTARLTTLTFAHLLDAVSWKSHDIQYCVSLVFQTSAGHQAPCTQDPVSTGVGGHAGPAGELRSETGSDVGCLSTDDPSFCSFSYSTNFLPHKFYRM